MSEPETAKTGLPRKPIVGLTGGPGSGKSTVAGLFAEFGCAVIDADALAHSALQDEAVRDQLVRWWGGDVLDAEGRVDRKAIGQLVFADPQQLRRLESIIHPRVHDGRAQARERFTDDPSVKAIVEDCPLLLESGLGEQCDAVVFVDCPDPIRLQRLQQSRGWDAEELQKREQFQLPLDTKRRSADYVIHNGEPISSVRSQVELLMKQLLGVSPHA